MLGQKIKFKEMFLCNADQDEILVSIVLQETLCVMAHKTGVNGVSLYCAAVACQV